MNEIRELTEMEVEAVSGGLTGGSSFSSLFPSIAVAPQIITQINAPTQIAASVFGPATNVINGGLANLGFQSAA